MIIYIATCKGKSYIGMTIHTLQDRKREHRKWIKNPQTKFHQALQDEGYENFEWRILATGETRDELKKLEAKFIEEYNPTYNVARGAGSLGLKLSDEHKAKIGRANAISNKGKIPWNKK